MNKTMKYLLATVALVVGLVLPSLGQNHQFQSFLNVKALNVGTNAYIITNLANLTTNIGAIYNPTNITYTNNSGTFVGSSTSYLASVGTTNANTTFSLFKDVALYPDSTGRPVIYQTHESNLGTETNIQYWGSQTLFIEYVNPLTTNTTFAFQFRPIYGDDAGTPIPNNYQGDDWWVRIDHSAGVNRPKGMLATNAPVWKWPGAKYLRLVSVTNNLLTVIAGPNAQTNSTFVTKLGLAGHRP